MRILQVCPYPTTVPLHGGQIRAHQIAKNLQLVGHEVLSIAVCIKEDFSKFGDNDAVIAKTSDRFPAEHPWLSDYAAALYKENFLRFKDNYIFFPMASPYFPTEQPWLSDYATGLYLEHDLTANKTMENLIKKFSPNIVIVEHPWLFEAIRKIVKCAEQSDSVRLVYSSHNIESRLKRSMARIQSYEKNDVLDKIDYVERQAVENADLVVVCTEKDAQAYRELIENKNKIIVAGNGVEPFSCQDSRIQNWRNYFGRPYPVFVSSAHIPNAVGFWEMMQPGLTFLHPDEQILILGNVAAIIMQQEGAKTFFDVNASRLHLAGVRQNNELQELICASHVVLLPITQGEGSNLKTAEALESGCMIIATSKAFTGYERAMGLDNVIIADNSNDFRVAVRKTLDRPRYSHGTPLSVRSRYHWESQLASMIERINCL